MTRNAGLQVVVNGRFLTRRVTGVERHGREILRCIGDRYRVERPARALNGVVGHVWEQFILPRNINPRSILWSPANTGPLILRDQALTVHDLSPLEHPEWFRTSFALWYRLFLPILVKRVRQVFTPSEYVKRKIMSRFEIKDVIVTPNGVDRSVFHPGAKQNTHDVPECYVLFVGSIEPRKNLGTLLQAWHEIKDDFKDTWLLIAGTGGRVFRSVELSHTVERVRFLGYVDDETLPGLYADATLFVLPSFEEGFGLPALEAMACGTPVIVSNGGALPETVADAGLIFRLRCHSEPFDSPALPGMVRDHARGRCASGASVAQGKRREESLSSSMRQCLSDEALRLSFKEKGLAHAQSFSWQKTAELIWNTLDEI
ncbi:MAG TPA: glycosyltransferase family 1 protein [Anaerolineales bacterium]